MAQPHHTILPSPKTLSLFSSLLSLRHRSLSCSSCSNHPQLGRQVRRSHWSRWYHDRNRTSRRWRWAKTFQSLPRCWSKAYLNWFSCLWCHEGCLWWWTFRSSLWEEIPWIVSTLSLFLSFFSSWISLPSPSLGSWNHYLSVYYIVSDVHVCSVPTPRSRLQWPRNQRTRCRPSTFLHLRRSRLWIHGILVSQTGVFTSLPSSKLYCAKRFRHLESLPLTL